MIISLTEKIQQRPARSVAFRQNPIFVKVKDRKTAERILRRGQGRSERTLRGALIFPLPLDDRVDIFSCV